MSIAEVAPVCVPIVMFATDVPLLVLEPVEELLLLLEVVVTDVEPATDPCPFRL